MSLHNYGIGPVLSHRFDNRSEHPVAFASRSLSPAEHKYAQIDKEGLPDHNFWRETISPIPTEAKFHDLL